MKIENRYLDGTYLNNNENWDREDAIWKANLVKRLLKDKSVEVNSICEVGCGSGDILRCLQKEFSSANLYGYDISPQLLPFWNCSNDGFSDGIYFNLGDFHEINKITHDVLLMLDVFEHVRDPFTFLENSRNHARSFVFHIPLDLSALGVVREKPLLNVRRKVGHLNFYTKDLALETLTDCGYKIIDWQYTGAFMNSPNRSLKTRLAAFPRKIMNAYNKDFGVRLFGGETLLVLAI